MKTTVEILGTEMEVEYLIEITAHGSPESGPSYASGGEPAEAAEWDIEILGIDWPKRSKLSDVPVPEMPDWLRDLLATHLAERDDINAVAQQIDHERGSYDPDDERI